MTAPTIDKLRAYLPSKILSADGDALATHTVTAGSGAALLIATTLNQADNYWNGAVGFFLGNTTTAALRGVFFHVKTSIPNNLTLATNLAAVPAVGDTFKVWIGGYIRSSTEAFGLLVDDAAPELFTVLGNNLPGLTIIKASPTLGTGTLEIAYDSGAGTLAARMGAGSYGTPVDCTGTLTDEPLFIDADAGFVRVDSDPLLLPVGNVSDTFVLTQPKGTFTPDIEGYEAASGKVRYRLEVVRNEDPLTDMVDVSVYSDKPAGSSTTIAIGQNLGTGAGTLDVDDASTWTTGGQWVYNSTRNNARFMFSRTGNTLSLSAMPNGLRGFSYDGWNAGDTLAPMSDVDIGKDGPFLPSPTYKNPSTESTAPTAITFSCADTLATAKALGTLRPGESCGVWRREWIVAGHTTRTGISTDTNYSWS